MNKKRLLVVIGFIFFLTTINYLSCLTKLHAQDCRIVKIHGGTDSSSLIIEPSIIFLSKGDCVVWFNAVAERGEVKVAFADGKRCASVTNSPRGFSLLDDPASCYVTNWLGFTGTVSLAFMEKGTYKYVVEVGGKPEVKAEGTVEVK